MLHFILNYYSFQANYLKKKVMCTNSTFDLGPFSVVRLVFFLHDSFDYHEIHKQPTCFTINHKMAELYTEY